VGDVATTSEADRKGWGLYLKRLSAGDGFLAPPPDGAQ
jgi:hypothetical protein